MSVQSQRRDAQRRMNATWQVLYERAQAAFRQMQQHNETGFNRRIAEMATELLKRTEPPTEHKSETCQFCHYAEIADGNKFVCTQQQSNRLWLIVGAAEHCEHFQRR